MFCEKCGTKIEDNSLYCENCGAKIEHDRIEKNEVKIDATIESEVHSDIGNNAESEANAKQNDIMKPETKTNMKQIPQSEVVYNPVTQINKEQPDIAQPYVTRAPVYKAPMQKGKRIFIAEIILLVILAVVFYKVGEKQYSPETVADNYFKAEAAGDWEQLYEMMDLPDSPLMTAELFANTMQSTKVRDITNYTVEAGADLFGGDKDIVRDFTCEFVVKGKSGTSTENISVVKQQEKKWLIFDEWKVSPSDNVVDNFAVYIPFDANAAIAGIDLNELDSNPQKEGSRLKYILPQMFEGKYEIRVNAPYRAEYADSVDVTPYNNTYYADNMMLESNILETVEPICTEFLEKYYENSLIEGNSYEQFVESVKHIISENYEESYNYEKAANLLNYNEKVTKMNIKSITYSYNYKGQTDDGNLTIAVNANVNYSIDGYRINRGWWTEKETKEPFSERADEAYGSFVLELVDGQWKILE